MLNTEYFLSFARIHKFGDTIWTGVEGWGWSWEGGWAGMGTERWGLGIPFIPRRFQMVPFSVMSANFWYVFG